MILKKAEERKVVEEINPYDWPENYYMETDPEKRKAILEARMAQKIAEEEEDNSLRLELWEHRYEVMRNGKIKDTFIGAWMDLMLMKDQSGAKFGKRGLRKQAMKAIDALCLEREDHYGTEILLAELKHTALLYACASLTDRQYGSVIFGFGKMKKEKINAKIVADMQAVAIDVPHNLELIKETALLREAISQAKVHMGYDML